MSLGTGIEPMVAARGSNRAFKPAPCSIFNCHVQVGREQMYQQLPPLPPPRGTPQRPLVPKRVCSLHASLSPPPLGILHATPDARPPPLATAPQARPQISDQAPQKRNAQTEVRTLDPILYTADPPCSPDNALTYPDPWNLFVAGELARRGLPRMWSRGGHWRIV